MLKFLEAIGTNHPHARRFGIPNLEREARWCDLRAGLSLTRLSVGLKKNYAHNQPHNHDT